MSDCPTIKTVSADSLKQFCREHTSVVEQIMDYVGDKLGMGQPKSFKDRLVAWANQIPEDETNDESSKESQENEDNKDLDGNEDGVSECHKGVT